MVENIEGRSANLQMQILVNGKVLRKIGIELMRTRQPYPGIDVVGIRSVARLLQKVGALRTCAVVVIRQLHEAVDAGALVLLVLLGAGSYEANISVILLNVRLNVSAVQIDFIGIAGKKPGSSRLINVEAAQFLSADRALYNPVRVRQERAPAAQRQLINAGQRNPMRHIVRINLSERNEVGRVVESAGIHQL